ncbi:MAG: 4Fe-4S dicluster domain-containing protein [Proteobacteria bacterium]|nr:4Fe-4S dicluster domain-containing protein [Pseudomonadota bacterium]
MIFKISFFISLAIFIAGILYRFFGFFQVAIGPEAKSFSFLKRATTFLRSSFIVFVSPPLLFRFCKSIVLDVVLQIKLLRQDYLKWCMHVFIYYGFMGLLLIHALENFISEPLFPGYYSTINPFMLLRNVLGVMVIIGLIIAIQRRRKNIWLRLISRKKDYLAIVVLAVIMISGFLLEGSKIISSAVFDDMIDEWGGTMLDDDELSVLKVYWQEEYGVVFPDQTIEVDPEALEEGEIAHDNYCVDCHSKPVWAFVSYPISLGMRPMAKLFNDWRLDIWLWYIHFLSCFIGLAYLPFSKFLHIITTPISILVNGVAGQIIKKPENRATRRALDLSACTQCGTCTLHCSVAPVYQMIPNSYIFPSEKILGLQERTSGTSLNSETRQKFSEGSFICTNCNRCSELCPAGINLQDLWIESKKDLSQEQFCEPFVKLRNTQIEKGSQSSKEPAIVIRSKQNIKSEHLKNSIRANSFSQCYKCTTCTNSCPIVGISENYNAIGMAPHQIMHALSLGLTDMVMNTSMIWDCLTCYQCQENCPQGVQITDIFYEIKNMVYEKEYR